MFSVQPCSTRGGKRGYLHGNVLPAEECGDVGAKVKSQVKSLSEPRHQHQQTWVAGMSLLDKTDTKIQLPWEGFAWVSLALALMTAQRSVPLIVWR